MKIKKYSREFKIGVFSLVVIVALYFVIQFLKGNDFFRGTSTYYAIYPNVAGLAPTSPVSVLGLTAETIDKIDFDQEKQHMVVTMKLKGIPPATGTEPGSTAPISWEVRLCNSFWAIQPDGTNRVIPWMYQ